MGGGVCFFHFRVRFQAILNIETNIPIITKYWPDVCQPRPKNKTPFIKKPTPKRVIIVINGLWCFLLKYPIGFGHIPTESRFFRLHFSHAVTKFFTVVSPPFEYG